MFLVLLLFAILSGCAQPQSCGLVPLAEMSLDMNANLMFVTAHIGGQPVRLLVDTGAERTVLTEAAAHRLGFPHDIHHVTRSFGIGGMSADWDVSIPGIVLGNTNFPVPRLAVANFSLDHTSGLSADGLLGADILLAFDVDINASAQRLTLFRVRRCGEAMPPWPERAVRIDGVEAHRDRLLVPFVLDGVPGKAILDTGAQKTTISLVMAQRLGLTNASLAKDRKVVVRGAAPQPLAVRVHRFRTLQVGATQFVGPMIAVVPGSTGTGDGLLGGDFLYGHRVWLSLATNRLFLNAPGEPMLAADQ